MYRTHSWAAGIVLGLVLTAPSLSAQAPAVPGKAPGIDVKNCDLEVTLLPDVHELEAVAAITFQALEQADYAVFELSDNLFVSKVLGEDGVELEFDRNRSGPETLTVRFARGLEAGSTATIRIEYDGGFDSDRYSRIFSRDLGSAYIGMEGTALMYAAKWFPLNRFLADRATGTLSVTVPLGMTVIGPGERLPVVTRGAAETFAWKSEVPILPGSFIAGQYFLRTVPAGEFEIECFARENNLEAMERMAEEAGKILSWYAAAFGPAGAGRHLRLVEVDEAQGGQHGMYGTLFVTRRELSQSPPEPRELARRIAGQWWQETVGVRGVEDLWLADGMAYYSAARYLGSVGGDAVFKEEIDRLAVLALKFEKQAAVRSGFELGYRSDRYESVVAGKGAWILHMLRGITGEEKFDRLVREYARAGTAAGGGGREMFRKIAEEIHGGELGWFFSQWIDAVGIPTLEADYVLLKTVDGFRITGSLRQERDLFRMPVEVAVVTGDRETMQTVDLSGTSTPFDIDVFTRPDRLVVDPRNKLLRDSAELKTAVQISLGDDLKRAQNFVESIRAYEAALKLSPRRSLAHFRLAEVFYEQFSLQSAANSFRDALNGDLDPKWIEVWCYIHLGKIYDILGQRQRAMAEYTKALNTNDDTDGAQMEAARWLTTPFTRERTVMDAPEP